MIRVLPKEEYSRLASFADGFVPDPSSSIALVAEMGGEIVGRILLLTPTHLEGPFVVEDFRGTVLAGQLARRAEQVAASAGIKRMFAYGANEKIEDYLRRLRYLRAPLSVWVKELA